MTQSMQVAQERLTPNDYYSDEEFAPMYQYLSTGELTGIDKIDKRLVLLVEQYFIRNDLLFKLRLPRGKRDFTLTLETLCVPKPYRSQLLLRYHDWLAHGGVQKTFLSLASRLFWGVFISEMVDHFLRGGGAWLVVVLASQLYLVMM